MSWKNSFPEHEEKTLKHSKRKNLKRLISDKEKHKEIYTHGQKMQIKKETGKTKLISSFDQTSCPAKKQSCFSHNSDMLHTRAGF